MKCLLLVLTLFGGQILCQRNFRQERQQLCYTPENYYGICVRLTQCPSIVNYYGQSRGSQQAVQYLYQVQRACGTRSIANDPVICCEEAYNNYYTQGQGQTSPPPNPFTQFPTQPPPPPTQPPTQPPPPPTQPPPPPPPTQPPLPPTQPPTSSPVDNRASNCQGPDLRPGNCVDVRKCQELLDALINDSQNATVGSFLRLSNEICRSNGYVAGTSVCCPNGDPVTFRPGPQPNPTTRTTLNGQECGRSPVFEFRRVVGGVPAKLGTWPWISLLGYDVLEGSPFKCGGTLISQRHVLTAAHCIRTDLKFVRLGEHDLGKTTETKTVDINIVKMDRHPQYNSRNGKNDLAVLHLESPVTFTELIRPACLPINEPLRSRSFVDYQPFVAGWGRTQEGGKSAEILQQLQLPVLSNQVCHDRYAAQRRLVTEDQFDNAVLCAGVLTGGMDTCQGDSGGPLMYPEQSQDFKFYVIGVVSYGVGCARAEIPGVYTNVAHFIPWIQEKVAA